MNADLIKVNISRNSELTLTPRAIERASKAFTVGSRLDPTMNVLIKPLSPLIIAPNLTNKFSEER